MLTTVRSLHTVIGLHIFISSQQKRQFIFEDIDESVQEEQELPFAPALIDENRNKVKVMSPVNGSPSIGQRTKTFIFGEDFVS